MAISNYAELKAEILSFLEREGDSKVTPKLDTIIALAESWINRRLRGYQREVTASVTADAAGIVPLPAGFVGARSVSMNGRPAAYSMTGTSLVIERGADGTFDLVYLVRLAPLSLLVPTNWLLQAAPDAYLDACLMRASILLQDPEGAAAYGGSAASAIDELTVQNTIAQYANARFTMPVQVP